MNRRCFQFVAKRGKCSLIASTSWGDNSPCSQRVTTSIGSTQISNFPSPVPMRFFSTQRNGISGNRFTILISCSILAYWRILLRRRFNLSARPLCSEFKRLRSLVCWCKNENSVERLQHRRSRVAYIGGTTSELLAFRVWMRPCTCK
jgi:hypothetical protein